MKIEMRDVRHLWILINPGKGDLRAIIIDAEKDVRICDGHTVVKVRFHGNKIRDVLQDDIFLTNLQKANKKFTLCEWACDNCHSVFYTNIRDSCSCPHCESKARFQGDLEVLIAEKKP